jgi:hypothetical protein
VEANGKGDRPPNRYVQGNIVLAVVSVPVVILAHRVPVVLSPVNKSFPPYPRAALAIATSVILIRLVRSHVFCVCPFLLHFFSVVSKPTTFFLLHSLRAPDILSRHILSNTDSPQILNSLQAVSSTLVQSFTFNNYGGVVSLSQSLSTFT